MILLDTDVMIDIMRKYPPALAWLEALAEETVGIPGYELDLAAVYAAMAYYYGHRAEIEQDIAGDEAFALAFQQNYVSQLRKPTKCSGYPSLNPTQQASS